MTSRNRMFSILVSIFIMTFACSLPGFGDDNPTPKAGIPDTSAPDTNSPVTSIATPTMFSQAPLVAGAIEPVPFMGGVDLPPTDLPFYIDCSALNPSRQGDCDAYLTATRDIAYPNLRDITGIALSNCYEAITFTIIPGNEIRDGAVGLGLKDQITYAEAYSIEIDQAYDVHELIHSTSACSGAFDFHVFHGAIQNAVYARFGVRKLPYFRDEVTILDEYQSLVDEASSPLATDLYGICTGILGDRVNLAYFYYGEESVRRLYHSTISPEPTSSPSEQMLRIFGEYDAVPLQALVEALELEFGAPIGVPACGL